ncbi:MAG: hypothetical protein A2X01_03375, partial [Bacteroidetes bacterium GWF2_35_48]
MKIFKNSLWIGFFLLITGHVFAQLQVVNTGITPAQMVQNVLVGGGVVVTNVAFQGQIPQQIGTFTTGGTPTNLGMSSGLVLSSGDVMDAPGPNNSSSITSNTSSGTDPDLAELVGSSYTINDAAVLQFDFVPTSDTVKFKWVFGSDEYHEYVNSSFNDVFGFFISGPGITGPYTNNAVNIALVPNTTLPVTIDNVNNGTGGTGPCSNCQYFVNNTGGGTIEYDGFTVKLTAWRLVTPCLTYHIKIAVADVGDSSYDSAVFLEAGSFTSNGLSSTVNYSSSIDTTAIRGCSQAAVNFTLANAVSNPTTINYQIAGTAVNGVDYTTIGNSVTIPAGQTTASIIIDPLVGTGNAPIETVYIITSATPCQSDTIKIFIRDYQDVVLTASNDTSICAGGTANVSVAASGGITPYTYNWSSSQTTNSISVSPPSTTTYTVTVSDACHPYYEEVIVTVNPNPTSTFSAPPVCASVLPSPINLSYITWNGTAEAGATFLWTLSGNAQPTSVYTTQGPIEAYWLWDNTQNTNYFNITLTITNLSGCTSTTTTTISVVPADNSNCCVAPTMNAGPDVSVCGFDYAFNASISGSSVGTWSMVSGPGSASFSDVNNSSAIVTVTAFGQYTFQWYGESGACNASDNIVVNFLPFPNPIAGVDADVCGTTYDLQGNTVSGMTGTWTCVTPGVVFGNASSGTSNVTVAFPGEYDFIWTLDNSVCNQSDGVTITFYPVPAPNAGSDQTVCGNTVDLTGTPNGSQFTGQWTGPMGILFTPNDTTPVTTAMVLPMTTSATFWWHQSNANCTDSDAVVITFQPFAGPGQVVAGFDTAVCDTFVILNGTNYISGTTTTWSTTASNVIISDPYAENATISINPSVTDYGDSSKYVVTMIFTVSNSENCTARDYVNVTFYELPQAAAGIDAAVCILTHNLSGRPSIAMGTGTWSTLTIPPPVGTTQCIPNFTSQIYPTTATNDPNATITVPCYGIYTFVWREQNAFYNTCSTTDTVIIEFVETPNINAGVDQYVCGDTTQLNAIYDPNADIFTWNVATVFWLNPVTFERDSTQISNPTAWVNHIHTVNDSVVFIATQVNLSTIPLPSTVPCAASNEVVVYFYVDYPASHTWNPIDSVQCGPQLCNLNASQPPQGIGQWVDNIGTTDFTPDSYAWLNACADVESYGNHVFYWVVKNGINPYTNQAVCIDSSDAIPIRFIQLPIANSGGQLWADNPQS